MLGDRSIHHPFSFSNSFFHCSEIGPRKDGLFGSSKMHCTQVSVCEIVMLCHVYTSFFLSDTSKRIPCESQSHLTIGQMAFLRQMSRAKNERREKEKKGNVIRRSGGGQDRWIWRLKKVHLSSTLWNRRKIICHRERYSGRNYLHQHHHAARGRRRGQVYTMLVHCVGVTSWRVACI